jgi:uncharacterized protein YbjT (DUF2867 family)
MILVTGATGTVGSPLVATLHERGVAFRALTRSAGHAAALRALGVEAVQGDLGDAASLRPALAGVDRLFLVTSPGPDAVSQERTAVDAAVRAGVTHVVKLSVIDADLRSPCRFMRGHAESERHLRATGIAHTILRPNSFLQNLLGTPAAAVREVGTIIAANDDARISFVDAADVARVAAVVLTRAEHDGQTYELTGPAPRSYPEIAEALTRLLGRAVQYVDIPDETFRARVLGSGASLWLAEGMMELAQYNRTGRPARVSADVERVTGRRPATVEEFLSAHRAEFEG